jgi:2-dehydropantoate 2-reductase
MADSNPHRVLVAGAGALGGVFGALLRRAGHPVALLGRPAVLDAVRGGGLTVTGLWGEHRAEGFELAATPEDLSGTFPVVLVAVKSYATAEVARAVAPFLAPDGVMVSLQNGLGNVEAIAAAVGEDRAGGARVIFGAEVTAPGRVAVTVYADEVLIGSPYAAAHPDLGARLKALVDDLGRTPIPTAWTDDLPAALWAKVLYNSALNPLGALLGVPYGALAEDANTRALMDRVIAEAFAVANKSGVDLPWPSPEAYLAHFYGRLVPPTAGHRSSMLQDLEAGRPTEIGAINGEVSSRGKARGVPTPVNDVLVAMIRFREGVRAWAAEGRRQGSRSM